MSFNATRVRCRLLHRRPLNVTNPMTCTNVMSVLVSLSLESLCLRPLLLLSSCSMRRASAASYSGALSSHGAQAPSTSKKVYSQSGFIPLPPTVTRDPHLQQEQLVLAAGAALQPPIIPLPAPTKSTTGSESSFDAVAYSSSSGSGSIHQLQQQQEVWLRTSGPGALTLPGAVLHQQQQVQSPKKDQQQQQQNEQQEQQGAVIKQAMGAASSARQGQQQQGQGALSPKQRQGAGRGRELVSVASVRQQQRARPLQDSK
jgi:hypothetical protein